MKRRQFTATTLAAGLWATAAPAIVVSGNQVRIDVKFLVVKEQNSRGFGIDLSREFPAYRSGGGAQPGFTLGLGIGGGGHHSDDASVGLGLTLGGGNQGQTRPSIEALMRSAQEVGRIGLAGNRLVQAATPDVYRDVNTAIIVNGKNSFVIGGLLQERASGMTNNIPSFGRIPVIGSAFKTPGSGNMRPEIVIMIRPELVDAAGS